MDSDNATNKRKAESTVAAGGQIDDACREFQAELNCDRRPAIEDYLAGWEEPERSKLLCELLRLEIAHAFRHGEPRFVHDYLRRFPDDRPVIEEAFEPTSSLATLPATSGSETLVMHASLGDLRYHSKGGLGVVYLAEDRRLKRNAAVKFIQDALVGDPQSREQFLLEAEITGRLEHPGVAPVYGMGETPDGRLFYAMRFIQGETLEAAIGQFHRPGDGRQPKARDRQVRFHELLNRFIAVCKTIAYAHNRGVVHRDIKPGNVMLGRYGETIVIDWGLAAPVGRQGVFKNNAEKTLTPSTGSDPSHVSGGGTPAYMSPEQASGNAELGPASDIYSLGATLYTLLTGKVPFTGSVADVTAKVIRGEFPRPTQASKHASKALEAICLKAMSLDPTHRYPTALELAEDVDRYLADAPVSAYQEPVTRRMARWARRHRVLAQSVIVALVAFAVVGGLAALWLGRQAQRESQLHAAAETARQNEQELRVKGLQVSAEFAAGALANQIDIRWRILEKEAADPQLHTLLEPVNAGPQNEALRAPLQRWLETRVAENYADVPARSWFVQTRDGTQAARFPSHDENGQLCASLGRNFAYRDYFHGRGRDYLPGERVELAPLEQPHNSTAIRSVNGGDLSVVFSVPIRSPQGGVALGVLGMSIELGEFADLKIPLPEGQGVLLVESRRYYMLEVDGHESDERGEGLVLHHQDLPQALHRTPLPHVDDDLIHYMRAAKPQWLTNLTSAAPPSQTLLPDTYQDPLHRDPSRRWIAAFAPVLIKTRPPGQQDTGWFVIVQQRQ